MTGDFFTGYYLQTLFSHFRSSLSSTASEFFWLKRPDIAVTEAPSSILIVETLHFD
jgi:hypothetical protein